jgi:hypothetical protein
VTHNIQNGWRSKKQPGIQQTPNFPARWRHYAASVGGSNLKPQVHIIGLPYSET